LGYLGKESYGAWTTVYSLIAMASFVDGGAGNATINIVARATGKDLKLLPRIVSTSFFTLLTMATLASFFLLSASPFINWGALLGITNSDLNSEVFGLVLLVGLLFFARIPLSLVAQIECGLQEGAREKVTTGAGALLSLALVYLAIQTDQGLLGFAAATMGGSLVAHLINSLLFFFRWRPELRPRLRNLDRGLGKELMGVGGLFFVLQIAGTFQAQSDNVLIAHMLGSASVVSYAVTMKLAMVVTTIFSIALTPLWPAYREALARGDNDWIRAIFLKSLRWSILLSIPCAVMLTLGGKWLIVLWAGPEAEPSNSLLLGCSIWMVLVTIGTAQAALLNSMQLVEIQIRAAVTTTAVNLGLSIILIRQVGVEGAVWGSIVAYSTCALIPLTLTVKRRLNELLPA
jgi:O-antigen/teichoic acid export membrane protein